jgi:hypothetical protein
MKIRVNERKAKGTQECKKLKIYRENCEPKFSFLLYYTNLFVFDLWALFVTLNLKRRMIKWWSIMI